MKSVVVVNSEFDRAMEIDEIGGFFNCLLVRVSVSAVT